MSTVVVGIGDKLQNNKEEREKVAGKEGTVFLIPDFVELNKQLNEMLAASCGKLVYYDKILMWQVTL